MTAFLSEVMEMSPGHVSPAHTNLRALSKKSSLIKDVYYYG